MLKPLFLICFFISFIPNSSCLFNDTIGAGKLLNRIVNRLNEPLTNASRDVCSEAIERFREFLGDFRDLHNYGIRPHELIDVPTINVRSDQKLFLEQRRIGVVYALIMQSISDNLVHYEYSGGEIQKYELKRFPRVFDEYLAGLRSIITPLSDVDFWDDGYFYLIATRGRNNSQCGADHNSHNFLIQMYKLVVLTEIEAHVMSTLSYACQYGPRSTTGYDDGDMNERKKYATKYLSKQLLAYTTALSRSLDRINLPYFRYCDPSYNSGIQDVSFFELDGFIQEVIFRYESNSCDFTCWDIWHKNVCSREWLDKRTGCDGRVTSCAWLGDARACALTHGPHKYQWVHSSEFGMLGNNSGSCTWSDESYHITTELSEGSTAESGCHCDCVEDKWKVYLGPLESRESDNYVIVGVRFRVKNNMLFLQPAQGKLHPNGYIGDYEWIDLPDVIPSEHIGKIDLNNRAFFLDDLQLKPGHALTGIQFHAARRGKSAQFRGFEISISGRPLDYETGKLDLTPTKKNVERGPRSNIEKELIYQRVRPSDAEIFTPLEVSSESYTYIQLEQSKLTDDFAQSTLPLFDSTPVVMKPHSPLAGISIFHKGSKNNSGFISVQVRPMSYSPYVKELIVVYRRKSLLSGY